MSNLQAIYTKILGLLPKLEAADNFRGQSRLPKLTDKQLIALALIQWLNQRNGNNLNNLKIVIA